jgi:glutaminase
VNRVGNIEAPASPIANYLAGLHARLATVTEGRIADYIPELGKADPSWFGIAIATTDGALYAAGDAEVSFSIQSVSKPFAYAYALHEYGQAAVLEHVGVEPTGEAFNSIILDEVNNRPFNPMVNAGAIAISELFKGETLDDRRAEMLGFYSRFAGRPATIDEAVYRSEDETGHRNRAIAYMMLNSGMISRPPADVLDIYFRQCSVEVTARDLAIMAGVLANDGVHPVTRERLLRPSEVRDVLTVMASCGMYDYAGQWAFEVGMPAKSGVSGGIVAVIPGQIGIGVFSPPLDGYGNSIRGVAACREISQAFGLHVFANRANPRAVIRREYRGSAVHSKRQCRGEDIRTLDREGERIGVLELQGALYFASVERLLRRVSDLNGEVEFLVLDFRRVRDADPAATKLLTLLVGPSGSPGPRLLLSNVDPSGQLAGLRRALEEHADAGRVSFHDDTDAALEVCEAAILGAHPHARDLSMLALGRLDVFRGLSSEECHMLEGILDVMQFEAGETILREGDPARILFVIASGQATVSLKTADGRRHRVASLGPGVTVGEMALLDGGPRSADVIAEERTLCYGLSVDRLRELAADHPNILITILTNVTRFFSERLRRANREIQALE